jgi:Protein of unknown function (DUF1566)
MHTSTPIKKWVALGLSMAGLTMSATSAQAALASLGNGTVLDSSLSVVWTQDASLLQTLAASTPNLVSQIISSVGGQVTDASGVHYLNGTDFDTAAGTADWYGAQAWVSYLSSVNYAGHSNWALPTIAPLGSTLDTNYSYNGSTDVGYNNASTRSQLGNLFYSSLGNAGYYDLTGAALTGYGVSNAGPFSSLGSTVYWTGTEADANNAYYFATLDGLQSSFDKTSQYHVLAVAAVPEPSGAALAAMALMLVGFARHRARK